MSLLFGIGTGCVQDVDVELDAAELVEEDALSSFRDGRLVVREAPHASQRASSSSQVSEPRSKARVERPRALMIGYEPGLQPFVDSIAKSYAATKDPTLRPLDFRRDNAASLRRALELREVVAVFSRKPILHRERRRGLVSHDLQNFALVPIVHASNEVAKLDTLRLGALLEGKESTWFALTRKHASVEVYGLRRPSVRHDIDLPSLFPGRALRVSRAFASDLEVMKAVAGQSSAIALVDLALVMRPEHTKLRKRLRMLSLAGIRPVEKNVRERRWPLTWTLRLVTSKHSTSRASKRFVNIVRASAQGARGYAFAAPR